MTEVAISSRYPGAALDVRSTSDPADHSLGLDVARLVYCTNPTALPYLRSAARRKRHSPQGILLKDAWDYTSSVMVAGPRAALVVTGEVGTFGPCNAGVELTS